MTDRKPPPGNGTNESKEDGCGTNPGLDPPPSNQTGFLDSSLNPIGSYCLDWSTKLSPLPSIHIVPPTKEEEIGVKVTLFLACLYIISINAECEGV